LQEKQREKKPLVDYSQSHVVTLIEYSSILHQQALNKKIAKEIRQKKWKEKEDKKVKRAIDSLNATKRVVQKLADKHA
jgi:hypothetical protein